MAGPRSSLATTDGVPPSVLVLTSVPHVPGCLEGALIRIRIPSSRRLDEHLTSEVAPIHIPPCPPHCDGPEMFSSVRLLCHFFAACVLELPAFLSESLEVLCLNDNHLDAVPPSVCQLKSLSELYLGK